MRTFHKPENILLLLLGLCALLIFYAMPLYTPMRMVSYEAGKVIKLLFQDTETILLNADIVNRGIMAIAVIYLLINSVGSKLINSFGVFTCILSIIIYYMLVISGTIALPHIELPVLFLLSLILWKGYFFKEMTFESLCISSILFSIISFIAPEFGIFLMLAIVVSSLSFCILSYDISFFYPNIILFLCGFCAVTASILATNNIDITIHALIKADPFSIFISVMLTLVTYIHNITLLANSDRNQETSSKMMQAIYSILMFLGAAFIGRFDYIANFT